LEIVVGEDHLPLVGEKDLIYALQRGMLALIAPSKQYAIEMGLLKSRRVEEVAELAHQSAIELIIVLVLCTIDHIKVASQEP
jgi:hypothetical protein